MAFYVYEDLDRATGPKVHDEACHVFRNRKPGARTSTWHGPFLTRLSAEKKADDVATPKLPATHRPSCCGG